MRLAVDTGGTFTDLVLEDEQGRLSLFKSATVPGDPIQGILDVLDAAAASRDERRSELLAAAEMFIHGTTHATNAILTKDTAKTAFLTTEGHPDILLFREGGRVRPFDFTRIYPDAYVPRGLTFEVPERMSATGEVVKPLSESSVVDIATRVQEEDVETVAVCLLWSIVNPVHEQRVGEIFRERLPGVPFTLSHELNPTLREYRRASSTAIDASLKPVIARYLAALEGVLRENDFSGRVLVVTSTGGVLDAAAIAAAPIHAIGSGPAMAPVAGRYYAQVEVDADTAVVADAGGTSYDVTLVRRGRIPWTRETWLGEPYESDLTGFPSVDVKSIGAGGGSIAWVDAGGLLHIGPQSAGADPGPVCYGRGGMNPTVTDAALVLGYIDPDYFLGGAMDLDVQAATGAIGKEVGEKLGLTLHDAAGAILTLTTEHMVRAIEDITLNQGIDPRSAVLVGGGGAAGLNSVAIARRLGCTRVIIPEFGAVLSAAGALMSDLTAEFAGTFRTSSSQFDFHGVNALLADLRNRAQQFIEGPGAGALATSIRFSVEARYPHQVWELDVPLRGDSFAGSADVEGLREDFHRVHNEVFAISDPHSSIEIVGWRVRVQCQIRESGATLLRRSPPRRGTVPRAVYFDDIGHVDAAVRLFDSMAIGEILRGPAVIESPVTTVVIDPEAVVTRTSSGSLLIHPDAQGADLTTPALLGEARP